MKNAPRTYPDSTATRISDAVYLEQVRLLYDQGLGAIAAAVIGAALMVLLLWEVIEQRRALLWLALVCVVSFWRAGQQLRYRRGNSIGDPKRWARPYLAGTFLAGCYWGLGFIWLFPADPDYQLLLTFAYCMLISTMVFSFSPLKTAFLAVSLPIMAPMVVVNATQAASLGGWTAVGVGMFCVVLTLYMLRLHRLIRETLTLRYDNLELINHLNASKSAAEAAGQRLLESQSLLEAALEASGEAIAYFDKAGRPLMHNLKFLSMWGLDRADVENLAPAILLQNMAARVMLPADFERRFLAEMGTSGAIKYVLEMDDHRVYEVHSEPQHIDGRIVGRVCGFHDVTERHNAEARFAHLAHHDALTGLPNRILLHDRLAQSIQHADRKNQMFALLFLDLDGFKAINDRLGHEAGDELLRAVAKRLGECVRGSDSVARFGGDEFVVVLEQVSHPADASHVAQKIIDELARPIQLGRDEQCIGVSIGIALYPDDAITPDTLLNRADAAMYAAKSGQRNTYRFFSAATTRG